MTAKEFDIALSDALNLVTTEQDQINNKLKAFDRFAVGVNRISTDTQIESSGSNTACEARQKSLSVDLNNTSAKDSRIETVRSLFSETVRPHSVEDIEQSEPLLVTIREEFSEEIALALAPSTSQPFTKNLKSAILSSVKQCRYELKAMDRGLVVEKNNLETAISLNETLHQWLNAETQPTELADFDSLKTRHEQLDEFRAEWEQLVTERQTTIHTTTNSNFSASMPHDALVEYIYQPLPVTYPVLSAGAKLIISCEERQQAICRYLTQCD